MGCRSRPGHLIEMYFHWYVMSFAFTVSDAYYLISECKKLTDATLVSKDGDTFGVHSEYIRLASSNLLPQDSLEPALIRMESSTQVVALLLEYLHLGRPLPHTEKIEHNVFMELAEAASKYDIYVAIEVIKLRMSLCVPVFSSPSNIY